MIWKLGTPGCFTAFLGAAWLSPDPGDSVGLIQEENTPLLVLSPSRFGCQAILSKQFGPFIFSEARTLLNLLASGNNLSLSQDPMLTGPCAEPTGPEVGDGE